MLCAITSFSMMAVAGRTVSPVHDTFEIMFYRSLVSLALVLVVGGAFGRLGQITHRSLGLHLKRNICHFTGQNLWFYALALIPLAQVISLEFMSPIWVALLAPLVLGERLTVVRGIAAVLGFAGVLVILRPDVSGISPAMLAAAASAIFFALSALFTRKLTRTETIICIMFWLTLMQAIMGFIFAGYDGDIALPPAWAVPWLCLVGFTGLSAHFCLSTALSLAPASVVMSMDFLRLPVMVTIGALFYSEPIDLFVLLGAAMIFGGNWLNLSDKDRNPLRSHRQGSGPTREGGRKGGQV
jgi:drug/metabolite transporter (DMT)-like permease